MRVQGLDGLRGLAILAVLLWHGLPQPDAHRLFGATALGPMGVRLFFVLSGFLITRLLIEARSQPIGAALWTFYGRRLLRLSPVYYAALTGSLWLGVSVPLAYWLYLPNVSMAIRSTFDPWIAHYWSLGVEEQFYVFWPLLILGVPRRWLPTVVIASMSVAITVRWLLVASGAEMSAYLLMPTRMDALGAGALCALVPVNPWRLVMLGTIGWLHVVAAEVVGVAQGQPWHVTASELTSIARDAGLVVLTAHGHLPALRWRPLVAVGRISYAVYVLHPLVPLLLWQIAGDRAWPFLTPGWMHLLAMCGGSIGLAALSWYGVEQPLARAKDRWFPVRHATGPRTQAPTRFPIEPPPDASATTRPQAGSGC